MADRLGCAGYTMTRIANRSKGAPRRGRDIMVVGEDDCNCDWLREMMGS